MCGSPRLCEGEEDGEGLSAIWHVGFEPLTLVLWPSRMGEARSTGPASFEIEAVFDTIAQAWSSQ